MTAEHGSLAEVIAQAWSRLSPTQQRIARYLGAHEAEVAFSSATALAHRLGTNPATVVRLARALGFAGYPHLQQQLRARFPHHYPALTQPLGGNGTNSGELDVVERAFAQDAENLRAGLATLDRTVVAQAVEAITTAGHIVVLGAGVASGVADFLASSLRTLGRRAEHLEGGPRVAQALALLTPDDLLMAAGFYRYVRDTAVALRRAEAHGLRRIVLTDTPLSPLAPLADVLLYAPVESTSHRVSLVAPFAVVNALVAAVAVADRAGVAAHLERLDEEYRQTRLLLVE